MLDMNEYGTHRQAMDWAFQIDPFEDDASRLEFLKTWKLKNLQYHEAPEFFEYVQELNKKRLLARDALFRHGVLEWGTCQKLV